eukprot:PITA_34692
MACVENINFSVIVNGTPSPFFKAERGLRQGCPLSPLLFFLVMNSLSIQLKRAESGFYFQPIKMAKDFYLSHNLFVDDILVFAMLHKASWLCLLSIFDRFQSASGICINKEKSKFYHNDMDVETASWTASIFGIEAVSIDCGMKYLGFSLKPNGYNRDDWSWLLDRFYSRILGWESRHLSLAGRLVLIQAVLSQLAIYWAHLYYLPASVIKKMKSFSANFLWGGGEILSIQISPGRDLILDGSISHPPHELVAYLNFRGFFTWGCLIRSWNNSTPVWVEASDLSLPPHLLSIWNTFHAALSGRPIIRTECKDALVWKLPRGPLPVRVKDIYYALHLESVHSTCWIFPQSYWKVACPTKMILLSWLIFWNRNLTWEVLQRKGWHGPGRCAFCRDAEESNLHMFFQCHVTQQIWYELSFSMDFPHTVFSFVQEGISWWSTQSTARRSIFLMVCWHIWKWRNASIFDNYQRPVSSISHSVSELADSLGI